MTIEPIKEGDAEKQGNAVCPQCGAIVLISNYWGDSPKCGKCDVAYKPKTTPITYNYV